MEPLRISSQLSGLEFPLAYARQGLPVFPCNAHSKRPCVKGGFKSATCNAQQIEAWFAQFPGATWGMPTGQASQIVVIDVDTDKSSGAALGAQSLEERGLLEHVLTGLIADTPSGGFHAYFDFGDTAYRNKAGLWPGVDVRGEGGYVIVPGSVNGEGKEYRWRNLEHPDFIPTERPKLPRAISEALVPKPTSIAIPWAEAALTREIENVRTAQEGSRNDTLFKASAALAGIAADGHLVWPTVESELTDAALATGLEQPEIARTIKSGLVAGSATPRGPKTSTASASGGKAEVTEDQIARDFVALHGQYYRYDHTQAKWFRWQGDCWSQDGVGTVIEEIRKLGRSAAEGDTASAVRRVGSNKFTRGAETLARSDRVVAVQSDAWDQDAYLLACPGCTVDLRTGKHRPPLQSDMITQRAAVAPLERSNCPRWLCFLEEVTGEDPDFLRFLQQICGYCLTGSTKEHALFFLYGPGGNGKSVFLNTVSSILKDYAKTSTMSAFTASKHERHSTELAMLNGARLVTASESEQGQAWAESRIKSLTGGDPITARFMRQDNFTFAPSFKLLIAGNHKPHLNNVDEAMKRRFNIIPFTRTPETPDPDLESKLKEEWSGILRWMINGTLDWAQNGLIRPQVVEEQTQAYFEGQDIFGQWLEDACICEPGNRNRVEPFSTLYALWKGFADNLGEDPGNQRAFAGRLEAKGFPSGRSYIQKSKVRCRVGISLKSSANHIKGTDGTD